MARWIFMAAIVMTGASSAWALDPTIGPGVSGRSVAPAVVATGAGRSSDDSLAKPGLTVMNFRAGTGVRLAGTGGGTNITAENSYHASGMGKVINGGIGRSTMETVPGRTPTYITMVAGRRMEANLGGRQP